jgi:hypothetical protein
MPNYQNQQQLLSAFHSFNHPCNLTQKQYLQQENKEQRMSKQCAGKSKKLIS